MEDNPKLYHGIGRRELLVGTAAMIATKIAGASSLSKGHGLTLETKKPASPDCYDLTLEDANRIAESFESDDVLDLARYSTASGDALQKLARLDASIAVLGLKQIDTGMATVLGEWKSYFLIFNRLISLTTDIAKALNTTIHALDFPTLKVLDIETAKHLVGYPDGNSVPLSLGGLKEFTPELAEILASQNHELYLTIPHLNAETARALAHHRGNLLRVLSESPYPPDSLPELSNATLKNLRTGPQVLSNNSTAWELWLEATPEWWGHR